MNDTPNPSVHDVVRDHYARISKAEPGAACAPGCCGANPDASSKLGYSDADLAALPEGSNLGLGCGNPLAIAGLRRGEVGLALGSGGGIDCFLAARRVGPTGHVIGAPIHASSNARGTRSCRPTRRTGSWLSSPDRSAAVARSYTAERPMRRIAATSASVKKSGATAPLSRISSSSTPRPLRRRAI